MDLSEHVERLRNELLRVADAAGDQTRPIAERLLGGIESAARLMLLEAVASAAAEITAELAPTAVEVRLRGSDPEFVVTSPPDEEPLQADAVVEAGGDDRADAGGTARINLRLPETLKAQIEQVASRERLSINAWLVRAADMALHPIQGIGSTQRIRGGQHVTGWVR